MVAAERSATSRSVSRRRFPAFPMSMDWLPDGRLLVVSARDGLLLRREPDAFLVTHADLSGLAESDTPGTR